MKYIISYSILLVLGAVLFFGCAETKYDLTEPQVVGVHGQESLVPNSEGFHAFLVKDQGISKCQTCHAENYSGGVTQVSCSSENCHASVDVHQAGINNPTGSNFHGLYIANNDAFFTCQQCHGSDWNGGTVSPSCQDCHTGIGVHEEGIINPSSENFHALFIKGIDWDLEQCTQCHGTDYAGKLASSTCLTCHNQDKGPEACNTCHGDFNDPTNIAPPQGTHDEKNTTDYAVGAHQKHLYGVQIAENVACSDCHTVPSELSSAGHIDGTSRAELIFKEFTNSGSAEASYNFENFTCENTYCHGNFEFIASSGLPINGNSFAPSWTTVDGTQAVCGTCHGEIDNEGVLVTPLPTGHPGPWVKTDCWNCHPRVVDNQGNIIDKTLHINGEKDVF